MTSFLHWRLPVETWIPAPCLTTFPYMEGAFYHLRKIHLKSNRVWIRISWCDKQNHQHICLIHDFTDEHICLFHDAAVPYGFPYKLVCEIVDQYYLTGCICDTQFRVDD